MNGEVMDALHRSKGLVQGLSEVAGIKTAHATLPAIDFDSIRIAVCRSVKGSWAHRAKRGGINGEDA